VVDPVEDVVLQKDGFDLVRCRVCGLLRRASLPSRADLEAIYSPGYFADEARETTDGYADYVGDALWHRQAARRRLALLSRFRSGGRLLDVGAAAGFFVDEAIGAGWNAQGIDVALEMVRWGQAQLGVPLEVGDLSSVDASRAFSVVTMWDYIEHSLDPLSDLIKCNELLASEGIVALSTGDVDSLAARLCRSRWHLLTPRHHNFFFSVSTLSRLLHRSGFELVWAGHPGSRYSLSHLVYKLDRGLRLRVTRALSARVRPSRFGRIGIPVNLFDIVTVVARKTSSSVG
jgi:hypothetical protein